MKLHDILSLDRVTVALRATGKPDALRSLAELFTASDPSLDPAAIVEVFEARETLASTGVGSGVAIPHGRLPEVTELRAALGIAPDGVAFDAIDGRPAYIMVAVLGPDRQTGDHLKALARISRALRDEETRERLLEASTPEQAMDILLAADGRRA